MGGSHAALRGIGKMVPQLPQVICRANAAAECETSCNGTGYVGLRQRHRLRDPVTQCKLASKGRGESAAGPVSMPVVVPSGGIAEVLAFLTLQVVDRVTLPVPALDQNPLWAAIQQKVGEHWRRGCS